MKVKSLLSDWALALRHLHKTDWQSSGWNMGSWGLYKLPESPDLCCGTVCCAFGLGTTLPSWKAASIELVRDYREWGSYGRDGSLSWNTIPRWKPPYGVWVKLGLTPSEFNYITLPKDYDWDKDNITPLMVAEHIEEILGRGENAKATENSARALDDSYRSYIKLLTWEPTGD